MNSFEAGLASEPWVNGFALEGQNAKDTFVDAPQWFAGDETLHPLNAEGKFVVEGTLRYQACDDRLCYIPQPLALKWTFQYEGFDRQRVPEALQRKAP